MTRLQATPGKYKVVLADTFDNTDCSLGEFDTLPEAKKKADENGGQMQICYIYDDKGRNLYKAGTY